MAKRKNFRLLLLLPLLILSFGSDCDGSKNHYYYFEGVIESVGSDSNVKEGIFGGETYSTTIKFEDGRVYTWKCLPPMDQPIVIGEYNKITIKKEGSHGKPKIISVEIGSINRKSEL